MIAELIRPSLLEFIQKKLPDLDTKGFICLDDLGEFRKDYIKEVLEDEIGELSVLDHEVIESLEQHEILSSDISKQFEKKLTFGERLSDHIASFGGSCIHFAELDPLLPRCDSGADHHDEPKSQRGARPFARGK